MRIRGIFSAFYHGGEKDNSCLGVWSAAALVVLGSSVAANGNAVSLSPGGATSGPSAFSKIRNIKEGSGCSQTCVLAFTWTPDICWRWCWMDPNEGTSVLASVLTVLPQTPALTVAQQSPSRPSWSCRPGKVWCGECPVPSWWKRDAAGPRRCYRG